MLRAPRPIADEPDYEAEDQERAFAAADWTVRTAAGWEGTELIARLDGRDRNDVLGQVTGPVAATEPVDPDDFAAAAQRPATVVTTTDEDLRGALESADFGRWKSFLHPTQARLVERRYNGPGRRRAGHGQDRRRLCTGCATSSGSSPGARQAGPVDHLQQEPRRRPALPAAGAGGEALLSRVEVSHVAQLELRVVGEAEPGNGKQAIDDGQAVREWPALLSQPRSPRVRSSSMRNFSCQTMFANVVPPSEPGGTISSTVEAGTDSPADMGSAIRTWTVRSRHPSLRPVVPVLLPATLAGRTGGSKQESRA
ncbi:hypothetical protein BX264_5418 [Streptomyces sp. 2333.5]|nr:hypothetical protein BX264_5418 [Streptomyces sp. 2333.5]